MSILKRFDTGYWSTYELSGPVRRLSGDSYHGYHCLLLKALAQVTGRTEFSDAATKWSAYRPGACLFLFRNAGRIKTRLERHGSA